MQYALKQFFFLLLLCPFLSVTANCQTKPIPYGNNSAAGKYYMFAE